MAVECTGRNVEVTSSLKELAEERTQRLERHLGGPADVRVVLSHEKHRFGAEIIAIHRRQPLEGPGGDRGPAGGGGRRVREDRCAGDAGQREAPGQEAPRLGALPPKGWRNQPLAMAAAPAAARSAGGNGSEHGTRRGSGPVQVHVVRSVPPAVKPMAVDEAALAMESSGEEVLVFRDASNNRVSVIYRRRDGDFGLIVPEC